ncbi:MAG TPA: SUMF1/EgtB/PvdO family nonheme iron enzyme [Tepidisphaeraceae bacterium]|jgi:acyl carrier protein|nr:SUMF1/EgtB/PvdO family nonheme iron enzyme [Tepidisphaeraceae bacterium]
MNDLGSAGGFSVAHSRRNGAVTQSNALLSLPEIESRVCDIASEQLGVRRSDVRPALRLIQDLNCDSLEIVELIMNLEDAFGIVLPDDPPNAPYKTVFTRDPFRLADLAELVYLQQGCGRIVQQRRRRITISTPARSPVPFTQLGGRMAIEDGGTTPLFQALGHDRFGYVTCRRRTDGMVCAAVPSAEVVIGTEGENGLLDERPAHRAYLDGFLIDQEPVSTTAYCRFLNSIGSIEADVPREWFALAPDDRRREHGFLRRGSDGWSPLPGTERMPMMLVSWYGANAYSLWANRRDWTAYRGDESFLPSEAQWEYAARGADRREYPWGDEEPTSQLTRIAQHEPGREYRPETLPMADVNADLGVSPFGLRHMAGNVWQWCRDWYAPDFYRTPQASMRNPLNQEPTGIRSERGGSWVGPAFLCRSSYRRGRVPMAKGRCLGFRCVSEPI